MNTSKDEIIIILLGGELVKLKGENQVPKSILEEILIETFQKLEKGDDFESELLFELRKFASERSLQDEKHLISILRGGSQ